MPDPKRPAYTHEQIVVRCQQRIDQRLAALKPRSVPDINTRRQARINRMAAEAPTHMDMDIAELAMLGLDTVLLECCKDRIAEKQGGAQ